MKIKVLALVMSLLLLCSCFVACNSGETTDTEAPETQAPETTDTEAPDTEKPKDETPGGETPGGETPGGETPAQTPAEKYADLYAQGYTYYENGMITPGSTDKYILDQDNFKKWYEIQLIAGDSCFGGNYILATDVTLNEGNAADWETTKPTNVFKTESRLWGFNGVFDGNGKTISGLCMTPSATSTDEANLALFGALNGGEIKNLRLVNSYIESKAAGDFNPSGSFAARIQSATAKITNCYSDAIIVNTLATSNCPIGGIAGMPNNANTPQISNCVFAGKIKSNGYIGGIVGWVNANASIKITDCVNLGELVNASNSDRVGGIISNNAYVTGIEVTNCVNLSSKVANALFGKMGVTQDGKGVNINNFVMITDIGVTVVAPTECNVPEASVVNKTLAEFLDASNKVFADWTYEEGYIPNPTTHTKIPTSAVSTTPAA